jgi:hypothetical protein
MRKTTAFFKPITFAWWQMSLLKLSLLSLGVVVGSTWPGVFVGWRDVLVVLFVVPAFYVTYVWFRQR